MTRKCQYCGATRSRAGRTFTAESLAQHERDVHERRTAPEIDMPLTDLIAADENDGVYFAIGNALGEW